jgi:uncharacterized protein (TIGR00725 family)
MSPLVGVLGAAHAPPDSVVYTDAVTVGRLLAEAGVCTICGGLGGVMEAVARGVREADGTCIGLLPGTRPGLGNAYLTIATGLGQARNTVIVTASSALIAIGGGWGTLNEVSLALKTGRPVAWLHGISFLDEDGDPLPGPVRPTNAEGAVQWALTQLDR